MISSHTIVFHFIYDSVFFFFMIIVNLIACKMLVAAIFSKTLFLIVVKIQDCVEKANTKGNSEKLGTLRKRVGCFKKLIRLFIKYSMIPFPFSLLSLYSAFIVKCKRTARSSMLSLFVYVSLTYTVIYLFIYFLLMTKNL